jgi:hypothetical protein
MSKASLWVWSLLLGLIGAIGYGIVHDQITVRICPEYLTEWHPTIIASSDPTIVALAWGVFATWWFGLILGAGLALFATVGPWSPAPWPWIVRSVIGIFGIAALSATVAGLIVSLGGFEANQAFFGPIFPPEDSAKWKAMLVVATIHTTSYIAAASSAGVAGIILLALRWRQK